MKVANEVCQVFCNFFLIMESGWVIEGHHISYSGNFEKSGFCYIQKLPLFFQHKKKSFSLADSCEVIKSKICIFLPKIKTNKYDCSNTAYQDVVL